MTTEGALYTWGFGACIGGGLADETVLAPRVVSSLLNFRIVDVAVGDNHIIALRLVFETFVLFVKSVSYRRYVTSRMLHTVCSGRNEFSIKSV